MMTAWELIHLLASGRPETPIYLVVGGKIIQIARADFVERDYRPETLRIELHAEEPTDAL